MQGGGLRMGFRISFWIAEESDFIRTCGNEKEPFLSFWDDAFFREDFFPNAETFAGDSILYWQIILLELTSNAKTTPDFERRPAAPQLILRFLET